MRRARVAAAEAQARQSGAAIRRQFLGPMRPVLWESSEDAEAGAVAWTGLTDNYLRVRAVAPAGLELENRISTTRLLALQEDHVEAQLVASEEGGCLWRNPVFSAR
jgi:hypothetical protein